LIGQERDMSRNQLRLWAVIAGILTVLSILTACDTVLHQPFPDATTQTTASPFPETDPTVDTLPPHDPAESGFSSESEPATTETEADEETEFSTVGQPETEETHPVETILPETVTEPTTECPHNPSVIPAVSPTCTDSGRSEGNECTLCGELLQAPVEVPPTGHIYTPEAGYACASCQHQALCPTPVLNQEGSRALSWGETLNLSWFLTEDSPFPVVYTVTYTDGDGITTSLWDKWLPDTVYTYPCKQDGEVFTLRVYAAFAVDGEPVEVTRSESLALTVTVATREALESPAFLTGNQITVPLGHQTTAAWSPVTADGARISYGLTLISPNGTETSLDDSTETVVTLPETLLHEEGTYTLRVIARDITENYRESTAATLTVVVRAPAPVGEEDFDNPTRYASDYYYNYLATLENGENLRSFYRLMDASLTEFHSSKAAAQSVEVSGGKTHYYAAKLNFTYFGLTLEEAASVRTLYHYDHPLYYWISNVYVYSSKDIYICVDPDYTTGAARAATNTMIYEGIASIAEGLTAEASAYNIALAYYERLLTKADYAYENDGETPQDDPWAHSVVGVFDSTYNAVVCEGFAEAYQLLLNYHGVENILVPGQSRGVGHLWNLLRLDNGGWYWCDITWDDRTHSPLGTDYKYFCVTDTQDVLFYYVRDGIEAGLDYTFSGSATFMDDHTVRWDNVSLDMSAAIPARAETPYSGEELTLRETFTVDGMTYALTGYGKVQLVNAGSRRSLTVPETVTHSGVTYTVSSIGLINSDGVFMKGRLLPLFATSVYIPKTVSYIWDGALSGLLVNITVDPENPWFVSQNGSIRPKE
jgi:hypothetical protein